MITIASVRLSGLKVHGTGTANLIWGLLWLFIEACISIMTISLFAFRTAYMKSSRKKKQQQQWYSPRNIWDRRRLSPDDECGVDDLPTIPSTTLSGMHTTIRGTSNRKSRIYETWDPEGPLRSNIGLLAKTSSDKLQEDDESDKGGR